MQKTHSGSGWFVRLSLLVLFILGNLTISASLASADSSNCKPPDGVPDAPGAGMQGRIDDRPAGGSGTTLYEQYGWSGLGWHTCDLGEDGWISMPEAAKDPGAFIDTAGGSAMMGGASTLGASMTQLNEWVSSPGKMFSSIDDNLSRVSRAVTDSVWIPWASVIVVGAACAVAYQAHQGSPRRALRTVIAIIFAALSVVALGRTWDTPQGQKPGAVAMGQFFDGAASGVIGSVTTQITGGANPNIAYGATLYDHILVPLWVEGAVGPGAGDVTQQGTLAYDLYHANTLSWDEAASGSVPAKAKQDAYVQIAKVLDGKAAGSYPANPAQYNQLRGVAGGRMGVGAEALFTMTLIAIVRIPASLFLLMGLAVIRLIVMFIPIWALFGILEKTRPTAISAARIVFAAVYNAAVFGVIGVVYTAVVGAIITSSNPAGFTFSKLLLVLVITIVVWVVSKPFRSVTVPATSDILSGAHAPQLPRMSGSFGAIYLANRLANRGLRNKPRPITDAQITDTPNGDTPSQVGSTYVEAGYTVEAPRMVSSSDRFRAVTGPRRRELPRPDDGGSDDGYNHQPSSPIRPSTPPKLPPVTATVPIEVEYEVIEPTRVLEITAPTIGRQPYSGRCEWTEVWRPPSNEPQRPIWEDRPRWRQPQQLWVPPSQGAQE